MCIGKDKNYMDTELKVLACTHDTLMQHPSLRYVFLELTRKCNLRCLHCGSGCPSEHIEKMLTMDDIIPVIDNIAIHTDPAHTMFCITGGEPLLNPEWEDICSYISSKGYLWGMTSNGVIINADMVDRLYKSGMSTISISIDGLQPTHERLRRVVGCYPKAIDAIRYLVKSKKFLCIQVTTVVNPWNINELDEIFNILRDLQIDSWRLTGTEPIGQAKNYKDLELTPEQYIYLFEYIKRKRADAPFEVTYGCSHFLPLWLDDAVRDSHFLCGAGILIASVTCEGDIVACLDINERDLTKQGNIHMDEFWQVWINRFEIFRQHKRYGDCDCTNCLYKSFCQGDSWHSWDFKNCKPKVCLFNKLKEN